MIESNVFINLIAMIKIEELKCLNFDIQELDEKELGNIRGGLFAFNPDYIHSSDESIQLAPPEEDLATLEELFRPGVASKLLENPPADKSSFEYSLAQRVNEYDLTIEDIDRWLRYGGNL